MIRLPTAYLSDSRVKNISKSFTHKMAAKPAGIDAERNYVTVTLCIAHNFSFYCLGIVSHCILTSRVCRDVFYTHNNNLVINPGDLYYMGYLKIIIINSVASLLISRATTEKSAFHFSVSPF